MSRYRYEIDEADGFAIRAWDDGNPDELGRPFLYQPTWPDNSPWATRAEAEFWAEALVKMKEDFRNGRPGEGPDNAFHPWTEEDEARYQKEINGEEPIEE